MSHRGRVILNFAHRCAMKCEWCYVPFESPKANEAVVERIVSKIADLGFHTLTIGGGDPFQYRFIGSILRYAKSRGLFVHVDTHGLGLRETPDNLELLWHAVDLLGLPIDGSSADVHDAMRGAPGHFNRIRQKIQWLGDMRTRLKVNTVISKVNLHDIRSLSTHIASIRPARWSIYQFWPLGPAQTVQTSYSMPDEDFDRAGELIRMEDLNQGTIVEINAKESRRNTYPIIHHDGEVFVHAAAENAFVGLGNIFTSNAIERALDWTGPEREFARTRYTSEL
jgi:MoaA/NifB/PqqE/SkfB family radical SAM enzyme